MNDDLKNLSDKISSFDKGRKNDPSKEESETEQKQKNVGYRAGAELIVNTAAGLLIGIMLDKYLGTIPLFLILFFLTGFGWGMYKVYKITENLD